MKKVSSSDIDITLVHGNVKGYSGISVFDSKGVYHGFILDGSPYKVILPNDDFVNIYLETDRGKAEELIRMGKKNGNKEVMPSADYLMQTV